MFCLTLQRCEFYFEKICNNILENYLSYETHLHEISEINDISFQNVFCKKSGKGMASIILWVLKRLAEILNICPHTNSK